MANALAGVLDAIMNVADHGLHVINYANGHKDKLDVAMRRTVLTGVNQTTGNLQIARADEMGVDPAAMGGGFPVPNMQNAAPAPVRSLTPEALADLRRWKTKVLNTRIINFSSEHIPDDIRSEVLKSLIHAETPEHVKSIFAEWMPGEASTKASPFPLSGKGYSTHKDDPFGQAKRMTESELEQALNEYFAGLAVRIGEQIVEPGTTKAFSSGSELKHPGHPDQSVHGRKGGSSIPDNATDLQIYKQFSDQYGVMVMNSTGLTIEKAQHIDELLSRLPDKFTKDNYAFTELEVLSGNHPTDLRANGFHQGKKITLYEKGSNKNNPGDWTSSNAFDETLYHEVGESTFKMITDKDQARWAKFSDQIEDPAVLAEPANERFAIMFSRYWVGDNIPLEIESWVK